MSHRTPRGCGISPNAPAVAAHRYIAVHTVTNLHAMRLFFLHPTTVNYLPELCSAHVDLLRKDKGSAEALSHGMQSLRSMYLLCM